MTGQSTVKRHAPGKLFIVGEYAVLEPGHPAILVAVDRLVSVTVSGGKITDVGVPVYPSGNRRDQEINAQALPILRPWLVTTLGTGR